MAERLLYLVRHGEADGHGEGAELTERGSVQARLTGERLRLVPFDVMFHSPLRRGHQTASIIAESLPGVPLSSDELVGDYIPSDPAAVADVPAAFSTFVGNLTPHDRSAGPALAARAQERFAVEPDVDIVELVVSHNFTIGGFVCAALGSPPWRWMTLNQSNCGITIIRYRAGRPPSLVAFNDVGHLH